MKTKTKTTLFIALQHYKRAIETAEVFDEKTTDNQFKDNILADIDEAHAFLANQK